ncbi:hypothetical protein KC347_g6 [Hortaea werneckii]|nr:hypothetical protein KC347_g6 [Hortaea werneckii]
MLELLASNGLISSRETVLSTSDCRECFHSPFDKSLELCRLSRIRCAPSPCRRTMYFSRPVRSDRSQTILPLQGLGHLALYYAKSIGHSESMSWVPKRDESQTRRGDIQSTIESRGHLQAALSCSQNGGGTDCHVLLLRDSLELGQREAPCMPRCQGKGRNRASWRANAPEESTVQLGPIVEQIC